MAIHIVERRFQQESSCAGLWSLPLESTAQALQANLSAMATTRTFLRPGVQSVEPGSDRDSVPIDAQDNSSYTMDQDLAQVNEQVGLTPCGVLPGRDTKARQRTHGPVSKAVPLPIAAAMAVATTGPIPGIWRMRVQPAPAAEFVPASSGPSC